MCGAPPSQSANSLSPYSTTQVLADPATFTLAKMAFRSAPRSYLGYGLLPMPRNSMRPACFSSRYSCVWTYFPLYLTTEPSKVNLRTNPCPSNGCFVCLVPSSRVKCNSPGPSNTLLLNPSAICRLPLLALHLPLFYRIWSSILYLHIFDSERPVFWQLRQLVQLEGLPHWYPPIDGQAGEQVHSRRSCRSDGSVSGGHPKRKKDSMSVLSGVGVVSSSSSNRSVVVVGRDEPNATNNNTTKHNIIINNIIFLITVVVVNSMFFINMRNLFFEAETKDHNLVIRVLEA